MELVFEQDEPQTELESQVYTQLGGTDVSKYLPEGYFEYVSVSKLTANYLEVTDGAITVYATNVTVGTQKGEGNPVTVDGEEYEFVVKPN